MRIAFIEKLLAKIYAQYRVVISELYVGKNIMSLDTGPTFDSSL